MQKVNYQNIRRYGRRLYAQKWLFLVVAPNRLQGPRYGWTLPRYVGTAVVRNKYKRWLRELLRGAVQGPPADINFIFKKMDKGFYKNKKFSEFKYEIQKALRRVDRKNVDKANVDRKIKK